MGSDTIRVPGDGETTKVPGDREVRLLMPGDGEQRLLHQQGMRREDISARGWEGETNTC